MKVVILCGGRGTRLAAHNTSIPKPLIDVGGKPILWHVMKIYACQGFKDFILCLGYKGDEIRRYFLQYKEWEYYDLTLSRGNLLYKQQNDNDVKQWNITFSDTGLDTNTGGRIKRIESYIDEDTFIATYADGLADIDISKLLQFHRQKGRIATIAIVKPILQFGLVELDGNSLVRRFKEKPQLAEWVNGGFFVFNREIFQYLGENDVLELEPLEKLASRKELAAYKLDSFWQCMDTYKDALLLNDLWGSPSCPWRRWR